uniref:DUF3444 domain-containing protein n=1 Tax=Populus trichocarpa TaxID=3694 RepID=A0A2K1ZK62_POPTR
MPIYCGLLRQKMEKQSYSSTDLFSNCMTGESAGKKNENTILPGKGEVWSCTRTGPLKFKNSDLENCEYDVVEVLDQNGFQISACHGSFSVLSCLDSTINSCFWELDHPALPLHYFALN